MKSPKTSNKNILILTICCGLILFIFGMYNLYIKERESITAEKHSDLKAISQLKENQIVQWHKERLSEATFFSNNKPLIQSILKLMSGDTSSEEYLRSSLTHILSNNRYENIFVLNPSGKLIFNLDNSFAIVDTITISRSKEAIAKNEILITDFYDCLNHNSIHFDIIAPLLNPKGVVFATLVFRVNPEDYLFPLLQNWPTPSKSAETLLVRKEGESVVFINTLRHVDDPPLTLRIPLSMVDVPAVKAIQGLEGLYEGNDYRGQQVLSVISAVPSTPWFMIAKVDRDEIFRVLYYRTGFIIVLTVLLIITAGAIVAWFYNYRQRNIYRKLFESEKELHQSQEEFRATLYSIGDGVITTDKQGILKQINPVAESLTGWVEAEARGKKLEEVFKIINEDTREKVENPVAKVLKEGLVVGLANHTLLISKNGGEIPIADSGAPIKNRKGEVVGVVMVFRDQSEERNNIMALEERERRYSKLLDIMPDALFINKNNKVVYVNNACIKLFGADSSHQIVGKAPLELFHPDFHEMIKRRIESMHHTNQKASTIKEKIIRIDGIEVDVEVTATPFEDRGEIAIQVLLRDVSERIRIEKVIQESNTQMRLMQNALDKISTCVYMKDLDSRYTFGNQATLDLFECQLDELIGKRDEDFFSEETTSTIKSIDKRVFTGEQTQEEVTAINPRGEESVYLELKTPIFCESEKDKVCGLLGISTNITKLKETERTIALTTQQLKYHIENSPLAVIEWDTDFKVKRWTARAEEFFGWSEKEVVNKYPTDWNFIHTDDAPEVNNIMNKLISGEVSKNISSNRNFAKDGSVVHCIWFNSALKDEKGELLSILSLIHNVTEQKQTLEELNRSREFILTIIENLPIGLAVNSVKPTVDFEFMNENFTKFYGVTKETISNADSFWDAVYEDAEFREEIKNKVLSDMASGDPERMKWFDIPITKDGKIVRYITARNIPLNERGLVISAVWDVTDRKMAEMELLKLKESLENAVDEKTKELNERIAELERFHDATIDRELRIKELRDEIKRLKG
jgi:PAS domain S-box-containing protein